MFQLGVELSTSKAKDPKHTLSTSFCEPFREAIELDSGIIVYDRDRASLYVHLNPNPRLHFYRNREASFVMYSC
jgi:hypothetical protein